MFGEAVAAGICMAADLSVRLGWMEPAAAERVVRLLTEARLPVTAPAGFTPPRFRELMAVDKKNLGGRLRLVLLEGIGRAVLSDRFTDEALSATLEHFCAS